MKLKTGALLLARDRRSTVKNFAGITVRAMVQKMLPSSLVIGNQAILRDIFSPAR